MFQFSMLIVLSELSLNAINSSLFALCLAIHLYSARLVLLSENQIILIARRLGPIGQNDKLGLLTPAARKYKQQMHANKRDTDRPDDNNSFAYSSSSSAKHTRTNFGSHQTEVD